ncbi:ATP-dependent dethiobiotin synthetase BioD [Corynebacterium incognita]|uniref:ATP-dependent dethiobiotin synthetase BioD n=1 Tax=Corynebacterium incognita TaxID=2754725 RepID=A0A7G7CQ29_9CORY|nr:dethiobiotin synthase [Corynebacterium incognita]QNE89695.1 ATP-dependent dethiobiotin synthetase BioD [Corynebacterium incognita]
MFIVMTGTGTDVGKTIATAVLARSIKEAGHVVGVAKPVQTGEPVGHGDIATVQRLTGIAGVEMVRYPEPLAPNLAARRAGLPGISLHDVVQWLRDVERRAPAECAQGEEPVILVEGAGGITVRLADDVTILDIACALGAPLVVVTAMGLGSLNLAELTVTHARRKGAHVAALVGGSMPAAPDLATRLNAQELPRVTEAPLIGLIPEQVGQLSAKEFEALYVPIDLEPLGLGASGQADHRI